jgi:membrane fusion protein, multidrug efflux system
MIREGEGMSDRTKKKTISVMLIMLLTVGLLLGSIFGYKIFAARMGRQAMMAMKPPPVTVTAAKAEILNWQPLIKAVGSIRAIYGIDVTTEIEGLVRTVNFRPGEEVKAGRLLVQLNADADIALLRSYTASAELAQIVYERDKKQFTAQAVSQATLDADAADLKSKQAQVAEQTAVVAKKAICAPFAGRLGITAANPGLYIKTGDKIVSLQSLDHLYIDFNLPQQELSRLSTGQSVSVTTDVYPGRTFTGKITTINPKVDTDSRNIQVEATIANPKHVLLPGMFVLIQVQAGRMQNYLTLPQSAITYNPYGETVYIVEEKKNATTGKAGKLIGKQTFVTIGPTRGDQIAVLTGIKAGDTVVTSGQLKLKNGAEVIINNKIQPSNDAAPQPVDE